jgi:type II secretory pathway component PulF
MERTTDEYHDGDRRDKQSPFLELPQAEAPRKASQFGLRHIMILSAIVAVVAAAISTAFRTNRPSDALLAALTSGTAVSFGGLFMARRIYRFAGVGWFLFYVGMWAIAGVLTGWLSFLIMPVVIVTIVVLVRRRRTAQQETMVWVLSLAAERGRPLATALRALAAQSGGIYQSRAERLAECLEHGMSLPDGLDFVKHAVSPRTRVLVRLGGDSGMLAKSLRIAAESQPFKGPGWESPGLKLGYFVMVIFLLQLTTGFILYFITPKFEAIFKDFGIALPVVTIGLIQFSHLMTNTYALPIIVIVELVSLLYLPYAVSGYHSLNIPFLDSLFKRRHTLLILRCLSMVVDADKPIVVGLQSLGRWYPATWIRYRLARAYLLTTQGSDWTEAMQSQGLITGSDRMLLDASRRVGNLPWAIKELAESSERGLAYRLQAFNQIMFFFMMLVVAAMVGVFAVGYFMPLVQMIERLAG